MTGAHVTGGQQVQQLEWLSGHPVKVLLDAATTDGQLMLLESTPHAGSASPMHVHTREDEMFVLLKGARSSTSARSGTRSTRAASRSPRATFRTHTASPAMPRC